MGTIYFLIFVGLCAAGLMWFITSIGRKQRKIRETGRKPQQFGHVRQHDPLRHNQARSLHIPLKDAWGNRRQHAVEDRRKSLSLTARKIDFDGEIDESAETEDISMSEFQYTPTDVFKPSNEKR